MSKETKSTVVFEESFAKLDIRVGRVIEVYLETRTHKPTLKMVDDFGKFGKRVSYGRFTNHSVSIGLAVAAWRVVRLDALADAGEGDRVEVGYPRSDG